MIELILSGLLIGCYVWMAVSSIITLTQTNGWNILHPRYLLIGHHGAVYWNITFHGILGSLVIPALNTFILTLHLFGYPGPDYNIFMWGWITISSSYPITNYAMLWAWRQTGYKTDSDWINFQ